MTSLKTSIKTITYLSDIGCLEIQGASLMGDEKCNIVQGDARRAWRDYGTHLLLIIVMITSAYLIEKSRFLE